MYMSIDFSGYIEIDTDDVMFFNLKTEQRISGTEYAKLTEEEKEDCIIDDLAKVINDCVDVNWETIDYEIIGEEEEE